jgi:ACS family allantoate permease-like MFS transporter
MLGLQYLFLIYGAATILWGVVMLIMLPDHPSTARFFTPKEREIATRRLEQESSKRASTYKKEQVLEALIDPQVWFLSLYNLAIYMANGGIAAVSYIDSWRLCLRYVN